ncbi:heme-dependent oxidative N-demethylase family protein [Oceanicola sp. S124]|uniref:heme-dependent oxidative N-demethylase family protein n=1 Tax=Oceanicola sp. S124 TaxID=1042378 RepID=UPI000255796B|nr:DUF3445 domain-containing protein [Oceanicola sp. S124]
MRDEFEPAEPPILQSGLPYAPPERLPGMAPLDPADWILVDDAFAAQMALREQLIAGRRDRVIALQDEARPAAEELLDEVLAALRQRPDYAVAAGQVTRPDGACVPLDRGDPLATLGRLVQQDFCLLEKRGEEHVLTGAVLCFPANWTLAEKFGHPLIRIHVPVPEYDEGLARRVQRLFDGVQAGRPLWRANCLVYADPGLHVPMSETLTRAERHPREGAFLRSERQSLWRLPRSGAVAFGIHTFMIRRPA